MFSSRSLEVHRTQRVSSTIHERCFHSPSVCEVNVLDEGMSPDVLYGLLVFWLSIPCHTTFSLRDGECLHVRNGDQLLPRVRGQGVSSTFIGAVRIHVFLKFAYRLISKYKKTRVEGRWPWRGLAACYTSCFPSFCPCIVSGPWSCRPQPWGRGELQPKRRGGPSSGVR